MAATVRHRSIRTKLIVAFLVAFAPLAVLHFYAYRRHYDSRKALILESHAALADSVAAATRTFIEGVVSSHDAVARTIGEGAKQKTLTRYLSSICAAHPGMESCGIITLDGSLLCVYPNDWVSANITQRKDVQQTLRGAILSVSSVFLGRRNHPVFAISSLVTPQDGRPVVVRSVVRADSVLSLIPLTELYSDCIVVLDSEGHIVCRSSMAEAVPFIRDWKRYPFVREALLGRESMITGFRPAENLDMLGHIAPIRRIKWAVVVLDTEDKSMAPVRDDRVWLALSIVVTAIGLGMTLVRGNRITTPLRRLSRGAAALAVGDFRKRIDIHTGDELESLARSFNSMAEYLERHDVELQAKTSALEGLFRLAQAITSSLDFDEILKSLVTVTCEVMEARACAVFLLEADGRLTVRESCNLSDEYRDSFRPMVGEGCPGRAVREGSLVACADIETQGDLPDREQALSEGLAGMVSVPLVTGRNAFGALTIWSSLPDQFSELQMDLLRSIASHASAVIQNVERYVKEYTIAETLQSTLLGDVPSQVGGLVFGSRYCPAVENLRVGGDFYDVMELPGGRVGVVIADVSGKGLPAAIHTAMCKYMLRAYAFSDPDSPAATFDALNEALCHFGRSVFFVTVFYGVIDPADWTMIYANAGHPPPIVITQDRKQLTMLYKTGTPLGFEFGVRYGQRKVKLDPGCGVILYTDGIVEARNGGGMLDLEGLQDLLFKVTTSDPNELSVRICRDVEKFAKGRLQDDVAVVAFARAPQVEESQVVDG